MERRSRVMREVHMAVIIGPAFASFSARVCEIGPAASKMELIWQASLERAEE